MAKSSGLGDNFTIDEFSMGGDVSTINSISCPLAVQEVPGITAYAQQRIGLLHDGTIDFGAYFNPSSAAGAEGAHTILKGRPTTDRIVTWWHGATIGNPAASLVSKQINYDGTRENSGAFTFSCQVQGNAYGLDHGVMLTPFQRTDTSATNGTSLDQSASTSFGWAAYLHVKSVTGTSVTVKIQDSADNSSFADLSGAAFTAATGGTKQRIASSSATATVRRYVRVATTGTFTNAVFAVNFVRYVVAAS